MFGRVKQYETRIAELKELYEARIKDLKIQVEDLRSLTIPRSSSTGIPLIHLEADGILSGKQDTTTISDDPDEQSKLDSEAQRILAGSY